ncbi:hypothetical protein BHE74_00058713 [Ensete ventricosum]|nr:hypothetical protein BHE74_00058713 [Ensete ventricosum]RZS28951.1 hypothetical protein BHM03_00062604 [Ensete ventricosum]
MVLRANRGRLCPRAATIVLERRPLPASDAAYAGGMAMGLCPQPSHPYWGLGHGRPPLQAATPQVAARRTQVVLPSLPIVHTNNLGSDTIVGKPSESIQRKIKIK